MPRKPTCLCGTCKKCKARASAAVWRANNRERHRELNERWRSENPERWKEINAASYQRHAAKRRAARAAYRTANRERVLAAEREYTRKRPKQPRNRAKENARGAAYYAIKTGKLIPQACESCGESPVAHDGRRAVHAHHDDYSKPLDVRWLCYPCHGKTHKRYTED